MKKGKIISFILIMTFLVSIVAGCGSVSTEGTTAATTAATTTAAETTAAAVATATLLELYAQIPSEPTFVKLDSLPELKANKEYTIGCAMTNVSTGWFKALYDNLKEKLEAAGVKVLHLMNVSSYPQMMLKGSIIVAAVIFSTIKDKNA